MTLEHKLKAEIVIKCEAFTKLEEIPNKELSIALTIDTKLTNKTEELKIATTHLNEQKQQHVGR